AGSRRRGPPSEAREAQRGRPPAREAEVGALGRTRLGTVAGEADRQELPVPLRRDVRLLGDLLGEVIREAGGQDLLDDVERLRRAVIAARAKPPRVADLAGDEIAALVASWPLARAEL